MFFQYYQTTAQEGEKKALSGTRLPIDYTKIVGYFVTAGTVVYVVVYVGEKVERIVALSKPGSDEERKTLDKAEKLAYHTSKGGSHGIFWSLFSWIPWPW